MAGRESLDKLIERLAGAVVEAQRRIENHQVGNFFSCFTPPRRIYELAELGGLDETRHVAPEPVASGLAVLHCFG